MRSSRKQSPVYSPQKNHIWHNSKKAASKALSQKAPGFLGKQFFLNVRFLLKLARFWNEMTEEMAPEMAIGFTGFSFESWWRHGTACGNCASEQCAPFVSRALFILRKRITSHTIAKSRLEGNTASSQKAPGSGQTIPSERSISSKIGALLERN
ncbi:hypothetical protein CDAR_253611 [Caerostris darwini]|uniref:Uncharacterized protein n=1 Tax=Caerostris darwini TaxID=1538125 RepID=A0AAV4Q6L8_9ARAC|nr:hypothetical protein CDAR_253611 [Caerostris darwini]